MSRIPPGPCLPACLPYRAGPPHHPARGYATVHTSHPLRPPPAPCPCPRPRPCPPADLYATCSGNRINFHWDSINRPTALMPNRTVTIQLLNVKDLAGNAVPRAINLTFATGTLTANVSKHYGTTRIPGILLLLLDYGQRPTADLSVTAPYIASAHTPSCPAQPSRSLRGQPANPPTRPHPTLSAQAPVTLNYVLGPLPTPARRLLFADRSGVLPVQLVNRLALRDESAAESLEVGTCMCVCVVRAAFVCVCTRSCCVREHSQGMYMGGSGWAGDMVWPHCTCTFEWLTCLVVVDPYTVRSGPQSAACRCYVSHAHARLCVYPIPITHPSAHPPTQPSTHPSSGARPPPSLPPFSGPCGAAHGGAAAAAGPRGRRAAELHRQRRGAGGGGGHDQRARAAAGH